MSGLGFALNWVRSIPGLGSFKISINNKINENKQ